MNEWYQCVTICRKYYNTSNNTTTIWSDRHSNRMHTNFLASLESVKKIILMCLEKKINENDDLENQCSYMTIDKYWVNIKILNLKVSSIFSLSTVYI